MSDLNVTSTVSHVGAQPPPPAGHNTPTGAPSVAPVAPPVSQQVAPPQKKGRGRAKSRSLAGQRTIGKGSGPDTLHRFIIATMSAPAMRFAPPKMIQASTMVRSQLGHPVEIFHQRETFRVFRQHVQDRHVLMVSAMTSRCARRGARSPSASASFASSVHPYPEHRERGVDTGH